MNQATEVFDIGTLPTVSTSTSLNSLSTTQFGSNDTNLCEFYKKMLTFDAIQLVRVVFMWCLFVVSTCGNGFILYCLWKMQRRSHIHFITLHLTLADLAFTFFSIPTDATWNVTMAWLGGSELCKISQMLKQFGMYISSFMVVAILFSLSSRVFCNNKLPFIQCVDFKVYGKEILHPYYFFTMFMSFILPLVISIVSYSLVLCEIKNMQQRDRAILGRQHAHNSSGMSKARKKTFILTSMVTASFILLWGPYYAIGIYTWFEEEKATSIPIQISAWLFSLMYVNPAVHPLIFGVFMKDARNKVKTTLKEICSYFFCCKTSVCAREFQPQFRVKQTKKTTSSNNPGIRAKQNQAASQKIPTAPLLQTNTALNNHTRTNDTWIELNVKS